MHAVADAMREEYRAITEAGILVQIDGPNLLNASDLPPEEERRLVDMKVEVLNYALRDIPEDRVRFHVCYPPDMGPKIHDPSLRQIIDSMLRIRATAYSFEASNARHFHDYHVFEEVKLPEGKVLIPGMTSHGHNLVEHPEYIAELTVNYARLVGRENVIVGNDCGFATQAAYSLQVDPAVGWAKLQAMAEGARIATRKLWPRA
jgi:5-methyltetrahydropteroyltriglutamate--homocysteine methyltransferase